MGSTNGILAYGYVIGSGAPPVEGLSEDEDWRPADFAPEPGSDEYYDFDFQKWASHKLLAAAGDPEADSEFIDPEDTRKHWGVWFEAEGWGEDPSYMLVTYTEESSDSATDLGNLAELAHRAVAEKWDDKIAKVLEVLGIQPGSLAYPEDAYKDVKRSQRPRWLLTSYYG